jgi:hypothetical protein
MAFNGYFFRIPNTSLPTTPWLLLTEHLSLKAFLLLNSLSTLDGVEKGRYGLSGMKEKTNAF